MSHKTIIPHHLRQKDYVFIAHFEIDSEDVKNARLGHSHFIAKHGAIGFGCKPTKDCETYQQNYARFRAELAECERAINEYCQKKNIHLTADQFAALVSRRYNKGRVAVPLDIAKKYGTGSRQFLNSLTSAATVKGRSSNGLTYRRTAERHYARSGQFLPGAGKKHCISPEDAQWMLNIVSRGSHVRTVAKHKKRSPTTQQGIAFRKVATRQHGRIVHDGKINSHHAKRLVKYTHTVKHVKQIHTHKHGR